MALEPTSSTGWSLNERHVPLTDAQREIWFASQLGAGASAAYNESLTLRLKGSLSVSALRRALRLLVSRHEALRVRISADGQLQHILPAGDLELGSDDLPAATADREAAASAWLSAQVQRPFDLEHGPLFRVALLRIDAETHLLAFLAHHVVCDGWSLGLLAREAGQLYAAERVGRAAGLPTAPRLSDYIQQEDAERQGSAFAAARTFWQQEFRKIPPVLELPTDRPRAKERTYRGDLLVHTLSDDVSHGLKKLCASRDCTAFTALLAAFSLLVHRLSGLEEIVIGVPSAAQVMAGMGALVGQFANLLPLRSSIADRPQFGEYLSRVREKLTAALEHWRYPFGNLIQHLNVGRDPGRVPLAPVVFNTTGKHTTIEFGGLGAEMLAAPKHFVNFDLNFHFGMKNDRVVLGCYYSTELYDPTTIRRWFGHFETLLHGVATIPHGRVDEQPLLTPAERHQLLREWNKTAMEYRRDATIHRLFEEQVQRSPQATAIVCGAEQVTYAGLNQRADALCARLQRAGVGPDVLAGILLERTPDLLVAFLGVLKAGGAYVPLDPEYPASRIAFIAADARMPVIITQRSLVGALPPIDAKVIVIDEPEAAVAEMAVATPPATATDLAYVIYTSGSTGQPKGVCLEHRGVVALIAWARRQYRAEELDGVLFATSATFDVSVFESLVPLCLGGRIILVENILAVSALPAAADVRLISGVPSAVAELVRTNAVPSSVITVNVAGEPCPQSLVDALYARSHVQRVIDAYGPTETTVYSTASVRRAGGHPTIGRPLPNERVYILDAQRQPVPIGVRGELCIGGDKLARGYLNRPELTQQAFIDAPFAPGERVYCTGDGARFMPDGSIEYLGRLDQQVKVRGFRIEPGEIEAALAGIEGVNEAAVAVRPDPQGDQRLVAYVVRAHEAVTPAELREALRARLPAYMVPSHFVLLEALPRTTSGKVNRRALPEPDAAQGGAKLAPPRNATEEVLASIWCEVLGVTEVGIHDNFFELGGHSLRAAQVIARVHDLFGVILTMRSYFLSPTIATLAPLVERALIAQITTASSPDAPAHTAVASTAKE